MEQRRAAHYPETSASIPALDSPATVLRSSVCLARPRVCSEGDKNWSDVRMRRRAKHTHSAGEVGGATGAFYDTTKGSFSRTAHTLPEEQTDEVKDGPVFCGRDGDVTPPPPPPLTSVCSRVAKTVVRCLDVATTAEPSHR